MSAVKKALSGIIGILALSFLPNESSADVRQEIRNSCVFSDEKAYEKCVIGEQAQPFRVNITQKDQRTLYNDSHALLILQEDYQGGYTPTRFNSQAAALVEALIEQGFQVTVMRNISSREKNEFFTYLEEKSGKQNRMLVLLAGHGDTKMIGSDYRKRGCFALTDLTASLLNSNSWEKYCISSDDLKRIHRNEFRHLAVLVNSCFSGAMFTTLGRRDEPLSLSQETYEQYSQPSRSYLSAANDAVEVPNPGLFIPAVTMALKSGANVENTKYITFTELANYVTSALSRATVQKASFPVYGTLEYDPQLSRGGRFHYGGQMIFFNPRVNSSNTDLCRMIPEGEEICSSRTQYLSANNVNWQYRDIKVKYFRKSVDNGIIEKSLKLNGDIPYDAVYPILPNNDQNKSNGLACTPDTPIDAIKATAHALLKGGVNLQIIAAAEKEEPMKGYGLQVLRFNRVSKASVLTEAQVDNLTKCPSTDGEFTCPKNITKGKNGLSRCD